MTTFLLGAVTGAWATVGLYLATIGVCATVDRVRTKRRAQRQGQ